MLLSAIHLRRLAVLPQMRMPAMKRRVVSLAIHAFFIQVPSR